MSKKSTTRFYVPTPEAPPRPPTPPDDGDEDEDDEVLPARPPPPSGPSRPPPPSKITPKRGAPPPPAATTNSVTSPKKVNLPVRKVSSNASASALSTKSSASAGSGADAAPGSGSAASSSRSAVTSTSGSPTKNVATSPTSSSGSSSSSSSAGGARRLADKTPASASSENDNSAMRLRRAQTWSGKRPTLKAKPALPLAPTVLTAGKRPSLPDTSTAPPPRPAAPPPKPSRLSRSLSAAETSRPAAPLLRRQLSEPEPQSEASSSLSPRRHSPSKASVCSIPEDEGEAAPSRPLPVRPPPARPAPPRPPPARPPPVMGGSNSTGATPADKPKVSSKPPPYIPSRKVSKASVDSSTNGRVGEEQTDGMAKGSSPGMSRKVQQSVRSVIKKMSPPTRQRSRTDRSLEEGDVKPVDNSSPAIKKRVWTSIRRVKRSDAKAKAETAVRRQSFSGEELDELGVLNRLVVQCVGYLNTPRGLNEEGLFRVPGDQTEIQKLRTRFVHGEEVDLSDIMDPNTVAGLLKLHFRELRFSIIPRGEPTKSLLAAMKEDDANEARRVMASIPQDNLASVRILLELLVKIANNSGVNKMTSANLGQTCGLAIFHDMGAANSAFVLRFLIDNKDDVMP